MSRAARVCRAVLATGAALAAAPSARAATIPDAGNPSLIIASNGLGMFAYYDRANADLMVGRCVDTACSTVTTSVIDSAGDVGRYAFVAPGTSGTLGPVIVYEDSTNHRLKLAFCVDPACAAATTVVVDPDLGTGHGAAVAIGIDGRPLMAYLRHLPPNLIGSLVIAHCENDGCTSITTTDQLRGVSGLGVDVGIGGDGLGMIAWTSQVLAAEHEVEFVHCTNVPCTTLATSPGPDPAAARVLGNFSNSAYPSLAVGPDGLPSYAAAERSVFFGDDTFLIRCPSAACHDGSRTFLQGSYDPVSLAVGTDNLARLVVHQETGLGLDFVRCLDPGCTQSVRTCLTGQGEAPSLVLDGAGLPLVAFEIGANVAIAQATGSCEPVLTIADNGRTEGDNGPAPVSFAVTLGPPQTAPVTVSYATANGSAQAGADYVAASGNITFPPGTTTQAVPVDVLGDLLDEADETFTLVLSNPVGAVVADGTAVGTIVDDDTVPSVDVGDCAVIEGNAGTTGCVLETRLSGPYPEPVSVEYATADGTATAGADYLAQSGVLTFAPGTLSRTVSVSVVGDVVIERDELFTLVLTNPVNATLGDATGDAVIVDDDASPSADRELSHGATLTADLAAAPGPTADQDDYRLAQAPFASYEVILDAVSGDVAPDVRLERIASDGSTVLQTGTPVGTGSAVTLRFQNRLGLTLVGTSIRVRAAACGTACGPDDSYRLRAYETTGSIPRFNNSSSQVTVLLLQNPTATAIAASVDFWDAAGIRRAAHSATLPAHGLLVLNTATVTGLAGLSGSITVTHDGGYGGLAGKAVALEPATGFSFDSTLTYRPR